ncbi:glutamyl-tRNA synthetase [Diplocarpon rosae]|nr:glutamyl-tRNA synthetase [Diplocarpon rosae]
MRLLLSTAKKAPSVRWVCQSCRGVKQATKIPLHKYTSLSKASQELRKGGPARTRFAPSPTGYLHLGSLRTALFNYLIARATGGQFLLRIEDTDQKRTIEDAEERLYQDLEWAGIEWDEGPKRGGPYGPYKQSERTAIYREHTEKLLASGNAYRCFCTSERLHTLASHRATLGLPPDYDRACTHVSKAESDDRAIKGESHVIRLKVPDKYPVFQDLVYGIVRQRREDVTPLPSPGGIGVFGSFDDPILLKSDGFPTYHLANVVDDHLMAITHVIRGSEWMSSTPKHLALYEAFGWEPPKFAHVGLLLNKDRQKLSKRHGSQDIATYREMGIFPETLTNYVALLGWSHNVGRDVMSMEELIHNARFEKLNFLQKRHATRYASYPAESAKPLHSLTHLAVKPIVAYLDERLAHGRYPIYAAIAQGQAREDFVRQILNADAQNYLNPADFIQRNEYMFATPTEARLREKVPLFKLHNVPSGVPFVPEQKTITLFTSLSAIPDEDWKLAAVRERLAWIIKQGTDVSIAALNEAQGRSVDRRTDELEKVVQKSWGKLVHGYLRWAITAGQPGPDGAETMVILGRDETIKRLKLADAVIRKTWKKQAEKENKAEYEVDSDWI